MNEVIIGLVCFVVGLIGGGAGVAIHDQHQPPKTVIQNIDQRQDVQTKNTSIQESSQAQMTTTIISSRTNFTYTVNWKGATNISRFHESKTNFQHKTNTAK